MAESNSNLIHNQHGNCELKPCPFCGGTACVDKHSFYDEQTKGFTDHTYGVVCENCNAQTSQHYLTKAQAKGAWNARTPKEKRWGEVSVCETCQANKVCDHNKYAYETCGNYIPEIVRCKNCQYWTGTDFDGVCIALGLMTTYANNYCSKGELRENRNYQD